MDSTDDRYGWPVCDWAHAAGISRSAAWALIQQNRIESVKFGAKRLITTHPREFLASLRGAA